MPNREGVDCGGGGLPLERSRFTRTRVPRHGVRHPSLHRADPEQRYLR